MNDSVSKLEGEGLANLAIDPEVLANELAAELVGDPLDEIKNLDDDSKTAAQECEKGLIWLSQGHQERLQGLRVFCEYRDPRALPLLIPLLQEPCPVERMSAVYALGRNPCPRAIEILLQLLQRDSNAYVRKATAWSLGNYADSRVLEPLLNSLQNDVAAVRLWAASSLAEVGSSSEKNAELATSKLITSVLIDAEPVVRSNCIWSLGRLYEKLNNILQKEIDDVFSTILLEDQEPSVRYEARVALEQLDTPQIKEKLKNLSEQGLLA
tara:strand:+ start:517 stop:1320 length:804 start_codon:yes stop_codon:yes gene_type:complete